MIRRKESGIKKLIEYALIIATFYITGGAFSYINYSTKIIVFFLVAFLLCLLYKKKIFGDIKTIFVLFLMSVFILLPGVVFGDSISTYIAIIMQLCIGYFCASFIPIEKYKKKYVSVIVFFALISLIGFVVGMLMPSIVRIFPLIDTIEDSSVVYYNAYIYIFMARKGYDSVVLTVRNAGICWEPGCYQMFLNIALFLLLDANRDKKQQLFYVKFLILIVTIITTVSTIGYILMMTLLIVMRKSWLGNLKALLALPFILCIVIFALNYFSAGDAIIEKIKSELSAIGTSKQNPINRISLDVIPYIFTDSYFFGMGFSNWLLFKHPLWNSIIHSFLCLGTPFTVMHLYGLYKGAKALSRKYRLLFILIIACACTETLFWRVFFNTIAFYGWLNMENTKKSSRETNNENFVDRSSDI